MSNEASEYNELLDIVSDIVDARHLDQEGLARLRAHLGHKPAVPATQRQAEPADDEVTDAQRYRWLRKNSNYMHCNIEIYGNGCEISDTLDEAIDAAMQKDTQ